MKTYTSKTSKGKSHLFKQVFWLTFLISSLFYAWYSFYAPGNDVAWAGNIISAKKLANSSDKNILLFFTGEWCSSCQIMKREVFADEEVMKLINSQVIPVMIDVDDPEAKEFVTLYNVGATPITIFTTPQGGVLDYAVGKIEKTKFLKMLKNLDTIEKDKP